MKITQALHRAAHQDPDGLAVVDETGGATTAELIDRVARLASGLVEIGLREGDCVGILAHNSRHYLESIFAIWWAGAVVNPINWRWSPTEIAYSLDDSRTRMVIVDAACAHLVDPVRRAAAIDEVVHISGCDAGEVRITDLIRAGDRAEDREVSGDALAGIFYTGGTTGFPKGVMLSHRNLMASALGGLATSELMTPGGCYLHAAPMFHLGDFGASMLRLVKGGAHAMIPTFDPVRLLDAVDSFGVTDLMLVPTMVQMLLEELERSGRSLGSVRNLIYAGSPMSGALLERTMDVLGGVRLTQVYGMTELSPVATVLTPQDHREGTPKQRESAGRVAVHCEMRVVAADGTEAKRGVTGQIVCRGDNVMMGYWKKPKETAEALRNGWMHTGDAGYFDEDGYLHVVDRLKDMIISGGENVYSTEVENALLSHPDISMAAVIGIPDDKWGQRVHAVVTLKPGARCTEDELRGHLRAHIAGYKIPRSIDFVDTLPLSAAGKVLKAELRSAIDTEGRTQDIVTPRSCVTPVQRSAQRRDGEA